MYAMGWTQHTVGTQNIRTMAIIQLLLGNMGVAGGGVNALRGESNVQGSTDHCLLWHIWPGYLKTPRASNTDPGSLQREVDPGQQRPAFGQLVAELSQIFGQPAQVVFSAQAATADNDFGYGWLPKVDDGKDYSWLDSLRCHVPRASQGLFRLGAEPGLQRRQCRQNPRSHGKAGLDGQCQPLRQRNRLLLERTRWIRPRSRPRSFSCRRRPRLKKRAASPTAAAGCSGATRARNLWATAVPTATSSSSWATRSKPFTKRTAYSPSRSSTSSGTTTPTASTIPTRWPRRSTAISSRMSPSRARTYKKGTLVPSFAFLQADGSTSSGNWLYCNSYTEKGNMAARRGQEDAANKIGLYPGVFLVLAGQPAHHLQPRLGGPQGATLGQSALGDQVEVMRLTANGSSKWEGDVPDGGWPPLDRP